MAYWTPGIGIFQYDPAGVGAPYTAAELIDVQHVAGDVAAGMAARYCDSGGSRAAAWQPWAGLGGIAKSEALYQEMLTPGLPAFARIGMVDGIEDTGGMQARTCLLGGQSLPRWYVDPARAQGANWWATDDPTGGAVGSGEAPLTASFYVISRDGHEERYWMAVDTGYPANIAARRTLGENARPRDGQPASGLEWWQGTDLCDTARPEMGCVPPPPPPPAPFGLRPLSTDPDGSSGTPASLPDVLSWMRDIPQFSGPPRARPRADPGPSGTIASRLRPWIVGPSSSSRAPPPRPSPPPRCVRSTASGRPAERRSRSGCRRRRCPCTSPRPRPP